MVKYEKRDIQLCNNRVEWKCECGFRLVIIEGYHKDEHGNADYSKLVLPEGKCLKCKQEITAII